MISPHHLPRWCRTAVHVSVLLILGSSVSHADLGDRLLPLITAHKGDVSVAVKHLETGESFLHRPDEAMPTASLIKLAVLVELFRQVETGDVRLDEPVTLKEDDKVPGSGVLTPHFSAGTQLPLETAARLMIVYSDNTATNLVLDRIGLPSVAATMESLGLPNTKINAKVYRRDTSIALDRSEQFGLGSTTARETLTLLERLHLRTLVSEPACNRMLQHLTACEDRSKLVRLLPEDVKVAHKSGAVNDIRCDAGILETSAGPIAICVLTARNEDQSWGEDNAGSMLCARIGRSVYDWFNPAWKDSEPGTPEPLQPGASGELVEALQRALNAKLKPSPRLTIDGDFGRVTQNAVKRFQQKNSLPETGIVDAGVWQKLGPIPLEPEPVPAPEIVNAQLLPRAPADPTDGPPVVTCRTWAVADAATGRLLGGFKEEEPVDFASTTKMMTAWLVIRQAVQNPEVLDEIVTFSRRADGTPGSTAAIRAGEKLPVRELLYGLMLPSGNDASVALAEHFGRRLATGNVTDRDDPLQLFIGAMNREAASLGMTGTHYVNPHGLTDEGHRSTARDLVTLARATLSSELYRQYVGTRQRGCQVTGPGGYTRNVVWKNTNELLGIDGYLGLKTGTTDAAGACLVSASRHDDATLIVVVLGSATSANRYIDSRNLHRWGWQQRAASLSP